jgi:hypothetical protein
LCTVRCFGFGAAVVTVSATGWAVGTESTFWELAEPQPAAAAAAITHMSRLVDITGER